MQEVEYFNDTLSGSCGRVDGGGDETGEEQQQAGKKHHSRKCSYDLLEHRKYNKCDENVNYTADPLLLFTSPSSSSSDEDNSPTEMNNCIKFAEKPTLVSREWQRKKKLVDCFFCCIVVGCLQCLKKCYSVISGMRFCVVLGLISIIR